MKTLRRTLKNTMPFDSALIDPASLSWQFSSWVGQGRGHDAKAQMNTDLGPAFLASWPRPWPTQEENCQSKPCFGGGSGALLGLAMLSCTLELLTLTIGMFQN